MRKIEGILTATHFDGLYTGCVVYCFLENTGNSIEEKDEKSTFYEQEDPIYGANRIHTVHRSPGPEARVLLPALRRRTVPAQSDLSALRKEEPMTLTELSRCYEEAAVPLRARLRQLRCELAAAEDPEDIWHLKRRIAELTPMLTQMNELAELTAHYYDRGYYRSEKYTL